ncbi:MULTISPECIES: hypothetical protein [unclassified Breznakia]|uniref:hypothetical protein n=1 Tax=unclassified Breznakia TaxID=2623764 RepID=UPI002404CB6C|nr:MULTISPECIES: hypothetical protein [unclassified Breznakia]MDF9838757.1 hypothetical protein [Breznakia sp. PFB2-8]MDF9860781.1 hypothetical protein [Breznakia sp. PH5-24]
MKRNKIIGGIAVIALVVGLFFTSVYSEEVQNDEPEVSDEISNENTPPEEEIDSESSEEPIENEVIDNEESTPRADIVRLAANETVVYTYADLKSTLESATDGINMIYLGADITMSTTGINVSEAKTNVTIDGSYNGVSHKIIEAPAAVPASTIYINKSTIKSFTLKNMHIIGMNYYGTVSVGTLASNVDLIYDSIIYYGPQITYNPTGNATYKDCTIAIVASSSSPANEVAEIRNVDFYGNVNLTHSNGTSIFNFYGNSTMTFHENANVVVNAGGSTMLYNYATTIDMKENAKFKYVSSSPKLSSANNTIKSLTMDKNSEFNLQFNGTTTIDQAARFSGDVVVGEGANFSITTQGAISGYLIYGSTAYNWILNGGNVNLETNANVANVLSAKSIIINSGSFNINNKVSQATGVTLSGGLTIEKDGSYKQYSKTASAYSFNATGTTANDGINVNGGNFDVSATTITAQHLIGSAMPFMVKPDSTVNLSAGSGPGTSLIYITNAQGYIDIDNPKSLFFSAPGHRIIQYTALKPLNLKAQQINFWTASAFPGSSLWDPPHYYWIKENADVDYTITGNLAAGTAGRYLNITSNYEENDGSSGNPADEFSMLSLSALAMGRLSLNVNPLYDVSTEISGTTAPNGIVRSEYGNNRVEAHADANGNFSHPVSDLQVGDKVTITANDGYYLYYKKEVIVGLAGGLSFKEVPSTLAFHTTDLASTAKVVTRQINDWAIKVEDLRAQKVGWKVLAQLEQPFMDENMSVISELKNALVFVDTDGNEHPLSSDEPTLIYSTTATSELTNIQWDTNKGILAKIFPGALHSNTEYSAKIRWTLQDAP